jgi:excisionase family DNA binding protein/PAS domain S-box-containing protein
MLTTGDVAKLFHVSAQTVINWLDQGRIPFERIGKGPRRITESNILRYIKELGITAESLDEQTYQQVLRKTYNGLNKDIPIVVCLDKEFKVVSWNDAAEATYGYSAPEVMGQLYEKIPSRIDATGSSLEFSLKSQWEGSSLVLNLSQELKSKQTVPIRMTVSRIYDELSTVIGYALLIKKRDYL